MLTPLVWLVDLVVASLPIFNVWCSRKPSAEYAAETVRGLLPFLEPSNPSEVGVLFFSVFFLRL